MGHKQVFNWLHNSTGWAKVDHVEVLSEERALNLLRGGANIFAQPRKGGDRRSPVERASALQSQTKTSQLFVLAAKPWSIHSHHLFPKSARKWAVELMLIGELLASQSRFESESRSLIDAWMECVIPALVTRESAPPVAPVRWARGSSLRVLRSAL